MVLRCIEQEASDIHTGLQVDRLQLRFREDGFFRHYQDFPFELIPPITNRIKIMSKADISENADTRGGNSF